MLWSMPVPGTGHGKWGVEMRAALISAVVGFTICCSPPPCRAAETSHLQFITEYIRELGELERLRSVAFDELNADANNLNKMSSCVRSSTRFRLELQAQIAMMRGMKLSPPFEELPPTISEFNERRINLYDRMGENCATMLTGPKPKVDYGAVAAEAPKITAEIEYVDHSLFQATPLIFATLIDPVPDANNHMSKLIITKAERKRLLGDLNSHFGRKMDTDQQNWIVSSASVLKGYLLKDYTASDETKKSRP
jgi:hypothetical protein